MRHASQMVHINGKASELHKLANSASCLLSRAGDETADGHQSCNVCENRGGGKEKTLHKCHIISKSNSTQARTKAEIY